MPRPASCAARPFSTRAAPAHGSSSWRRRSTSRIPFAEPSRARRVRVALACAGAFAFLWLVRRAGVGTIASTLARLDPRWLALCIAIEAAIFTGYAVRWGWVLRAAGGEATFGRLLGARLAGVAAGALTPGAKVGGEPLRALLLAEAGVPAGPAIASVVVDRGIELLANVAFAGGYCALFAARDAAGAGRVVPVVVASGIALAGAALLLRRRLGRGEGLVPERFLPVLARLGGTTDVLASTETSLRAVLFGHRRLLLAVLATALVLNALVFAEYAALLAAFDAGATLPELAGVLLGVGLAHALPVPGSIGALEGAQVAFAKAAGGGVALAVTAATAARLRDLLWTTPGTLWLATGARGGRGGPLDERGRNALTTDASTTRRER
ncbi:MAG: lysylphosphatidylglycerol synthase transmembrane domain-containing protein [Alphaproteobacteria bacterium]